MFGSDESAPPFWPISIASLTAPFGAHVLACSRERAKHSERRTGEAIPSNRHYWPYWRRSNTSRL